MNKVAKKHSAMNYGIRCNIGSRNQQQDNKTSTVKARINPKLSNWNFSRRIYNEMYEMS